MDKLDLQSTPTKNIDGSISIPQKFTVEDIKAYKCLSDDRVTALKNSINSAQELLAEEEAKNAKLVEWLGIFKS